MDYTTTSNSPNDTTRTKPHSSSSIHSTRIHFHANDPSPSRRNHLHSHAEKGPHTPHPRRAGRSMDPKDKPTTTPPQRKLFVGSLGLDERNVSPQREPDDHTDAEMQVGVFSNEYDLDPRILQEVQRALRMKARREARLKREIITIPENALTTPATKFPQSNHTPPKRGIFPLSPPSSPTPPRKLSNSTMSDVDFSPSTGAFNIPFPHPVPSSPDNGMTLDWTSSVSDEDRHDRRWAISMHKRRGKDKVVPLKDTIEQQERLHKEKLSRIKTIASPQTIRKVKIISEQLERRYKLIYGSISAHSQPLNIANIARWYGSQDDLIKNALEKAEPLTWLKHLDKRGVKPKRLQWHLSALILEEYFVAQNRHDQMETIPEDSPFQPAFVDTSRLPRSPPASIFSPTFHISPHSNGTSNPSYEALIQSEPNREMETESRKSTESGFSNPVGANTVPSATSLLGSRLQMLNNEAEDLSQTSDDTNERGYNRYSTPERAEQRSSSPWSSRNRAEYNTVNKPEIRVIISHSPERKSGQLADHGTSSRLRVSASPLSDKEDSSAVEHSPARLSQTAINRKLKSRRVRMSLPTELPENKRAHEAEEVSRHEYEVKARLLEQVTANNHRIRQLLNRIASGVREYELGQSNAMRTLGVSYSGLPRELIEAFSHDPAAVTGSTRRLTGYKAVEDIHDRLSRQRATLQNFITKRCNQPSGSVLHDPINALLKDLKDLEDHKQVIASKVCLTTNLLQKVQKLHGEVKENYNDALYKTSIVYPELSHLVDLEENYRYQYQQFWEFGMDALTFLLDTVTPFWRTYGKRIGEDVRDFLIVPLYRNEFTGEAKRYLIKEMPKRSLRHWMGLLTFFILSFTITILQARAAISSSSHCRLRWIPYESVRYTALPFFWFGILMQWLVVVIEFAIVFMQVGIVAWWAGWSVKIFT